MAGGKGKMPNVVGMTFEKARAKIGIDSTRIIRADTFDTDTAAWKAGIVIRQSPREGESLKPDTVKVRLAVEQPYAVVPVVKGLDGARAGAKIGAAGFALGLSSRCLKSSPLQDGTVVDVRPGEGTLQPRSTTVTLVILVIQPAGCFVINFDSLKIQQPYIQEYKRVVVPQSARSAVPISP
jgi:beta-lactam-binding protein with PASTA domain